MSGRRAPVLLYDGACGFCARSVRLARRLPAEFDVLAWQDADLPDLGVDPAMAAESVQWVAPDGTVAAGHRAVAALLVASGWPWRWAGRAMLLPGIDRLAAAVYLWVARNRHRIPWPLSTSPRHPGSPPTE